MKRQSLGVRRSMRLDVGLEPDQNDLEYPAETFALFLWEQREAIEGLTPGE